MSDAPGGAAARPLDAVYQRTFRLPEMEHTSLFQQSKVRQFRVAIPIPSKTGF